VSQFVVSQFVVSQFVVSQFVVFQFDVTASMSKMLTASSRLMSPSIVGRAGMTAMMLAPTD